MSQIVQTTPSGLAESFPVTNLTLVVLLLIPCVVILLLLNCLFLGYKLLALSKTKSRRKREDTEGMLLQSTIQRLRRLSDVHFPALQHARGACMSLSEPVLHHPVTSSRASSRERAAGMDHRFRCLRPDGATGSGSLRAPSSIRPASSAVGFSPRLDLHSGLRTYSVGRARWCKSAPVFPQSTDSEAETRVVVAPPNSPETDCVGHIRQSTTFKMLPNVNPVVDAHMPDNAEMEYEYIERLSEVSGINASAVGPGLDSDFGASAGVSLRILSADSDTLSNGAVSSALEWDYYDPCYVKQNNVPKLKHHRPAVHTKQYWV